MANLKQKFGGLAAQLEGDASSFQVKARLTMALALLKWVEKFLYKWHIKTIKVCAYLVAAMKQRSVAE